MLRETGWWVASNQAQFEIGSFVQLLNLVSLRKS